MFWNKVLRGISLYLLIAIVAVTLVSGLSRLRRLARSWRTTSLLTCSKGTRSLKYR